MPTHIKGLRAKAQQVRGFREATAKFETELSEEVVAWREALRGGESTGDPLLDWLLLYYGAELFFQPEIETYYRGLEKAVFDYHLEMVLVSKKSELCLRPDWPKNRLHHEGVVIGILENRSLILKSHSEDDPLNLLLQEKSEVLVGLPTGVHVLWGKPEKPQMIGRNIALVETRGLDRWDPHQDTKEKLQTSPVHGQAKGPHYKMEIVFGNDKVRAWCAEHEFHSELEDAITFLA